MKITYKNTIEEYRNLHLFYKRRNKFKYFIPPIIFLIATIYQGIITYKLYDNYNMIGFKKSLIVTILVGIITIIISLSFTQKGLLKVFEWSLKLLHKCNPEIVLGEKSIELNEDFIVFKAENTIEKIIKYKKINRLIQNEGCIYIDLKSIDKGWLSIPIIPIESFENKDEYIKFKELINSNIKGTIN
ncbi:MAG: hypothetical protein ACRDCB_13975 [Clostridium sp.]|uniref:hypothetical protein n=1 Tax=Clostridium chrysemydis TaxID=2665504 RepID=UPI003EE7B169